MANLLLLGSFPCLPCLFVCLFVLYAQIVYDPRSLLNVLFRWRGSVLPHIRAHLVGTVRVQSVGSGGQK